MPTIKEQFRFHPINSHFEFDTHTEVQNLAIQRFKVLAGNTPDEDILVVEYKGSPNLSFYNVHGQILDIDHYLPETYRDYDNINVESIISNLKSSDIAALKSSKDFDSLLEQTLAAADNDIVKGLQQQFGILTFEEVVYSIIPNLRDAEQEDIFNIIRNAYSSYYDFVSDVIISQQRSAGYVHITPVGNIIITPLNKRSGLSVIIETQDAKGQLSHPSKWNVVRTQSAVQLDQVLVFRTLDVKNYFLASTYTDTFETERYVLKYDDKELSIDSYLDNTDNLLKVKVINDCYKVMASDYNLIFVLSKVNELTIINTHSSVVPHKWPKTISLPVTAEWVRIDENMTVVFCQDSTGMISCYDITGSVVEKISEIGVYAPRFELDQNGHLICRESDSSNLIKIETNLSDIELPSDKKNFNTVFNNLSHLFRGERLFVKTEFAKPISESEETPSKLPSVIQKARYDFETNIENMLVQSDNSYEDLLSIQNKMAIARQNITEELMAEADKENIFLVGQRLKTTINSIILPSEKRVRNLVEGLRAKSILVTSKSYQAQAQGLDDPYAYREVLNKIRGFQDELLSMHPDNFSEILDEFKAIKEDLDSSFSEQIAKEGTTLQEFIASEIEEIENQIKKTHDIKVLENLLSTHPAAMELLTLLKQPFLLQSIAKEKQLSPAAIQSRLHKAVANRKLALIGEEERLEAQRNAAKQQLIEMIRKNIDFFVSNHSSGFSDLELSTNPSYQGILTDISKLEGVYNDVRMAVDLRRLLQRRILERNRTNLEKSLSFEGKYAFVKNDPQLYVDMDSMVQRFPKWHLHLKEKQGSHDRYLVMFERETDKEVYRPSTSDNLRSGKAFELASSEYAEFFVKYDLYVKEEYPYGLLDALWRITIGEMTEVNYPQYAKTTINALLPKEEIDKKALRCALEKKSRDNLESTRTRNVPVIPPEFIDYTPYFNHKLHEFVLKAKLQLESGSGILLLTGPPSTGKSAFLRYAASIMNREYFEHASDKWQTKNSLVTAIRFGEFGPYSVPAGFTKAITTPNSLINIEEIKEWPEALRKSLNPFFAGSEVFYSPDGTRYDIAENILLCAATNLGAIYRQDDEPFTADFWSRIEVIEYDYAPMHVSREYYDAIFKPKVEKILTVQDLARKHFMYDLAPKDPGNKAKYFAQQFIEFILLPKADERIKRINLANHINEYFANDITKEDAAISPEEAVKVSLKRLKDFQGLKPKEFYDLYDHFINDEILRTRRFLTMKTRDNTMYEHLKVLILCIGHIESCLRSLRKVFYSSAGQTEIEGTNREFIKCVHLLGLLGKL